MDVVQAEQGRLDRQCPHSRDVVRNVDNFAVGFSRGQAEPSTDHLSEQVLALRWPREDDAVDLG